MNTDYTYLEIATVTTNSFTCTVADSGDTSGSDGAYIPAFDITSMSDTALTFVSPSAGNVQLISFTHFIESSENAAITVTVPSNAISNGAGGNSAINNKIIPILAGYNVQSSGFAILSGLGLSFSTTANFNQYTVSGGLGYFDRFAYSLHF